MDIYTLIFITFCLGLIIMIILISNRMLKNKTDLIFKRKKEDYTNELNKINNEILYLIKQNVKKELSQCIGEIVDFDKYKYNSYWNGSDLPPYVSHLRKEIANEIRGRFKQELENISDRHKRIDDLEKYMENELREQVYNVVSSEKFIDDVVKRIKTKQLN